MGIEIVDQVKDVGAVIVPVGGAGLLAGVSLAVKTLRPQTKIIAVEAENVSSFSAAFKAGAPTKINLQPTLADGLAIPQVGANAFATAREHVDQVVEVTEEQIAIAILRLIELEKTVVEGAAATPLAAISPANALFFYYAAETLIRTFLAASLNAVLWPMAA